jgi:hypothetical protein
MHALISGLFTTVLPVAVLAAILGTVGGILFKKMDRKINQKLSGVSKNGPATNERCR